MIAAWLVRALVAGTLIALAGRAADEIATVSAGPRRWVWVGSLTLATALPVLAWYGPDVLAGEAELFPVEWLLAAISRVVSGLVASDAASALVATVGMSGQISATNEAAGTPFPDWLATVDAVLLVLWAASSAVLLAAFTWVHLRMHAARAGARAFHVGGVRVLVTDRMGPAAVGLLRPAVIIPRWVTEAPPEERRFILEHEHEHIRAGDVWLLRAALVPLLLLPWCAPLWWIYRRLRDAVETDCDARVLSGNIDGNADVRAYATTLLRAASRPAKISFSGPALGQKSSLERRIRAMTAPRPRHLVLRTVALSAAAAAGAIAACDAASPPVTQPEEAGVAEAVREQILNVADARPKPTIWINGERVDRSDPSAVERIEPTQIRSVEIVKSAVRDMSGAEAGSVVRDMSGAEAGRSSRVSGPAQIRSVEIAEAGRSSRPSDRSRAARPEPLFLVDGVRVADLDPLRPDDIATIEVIKGPAAAALYGEEAEAGVVRVTTK